MPIDNALTKLLRIRHPVVLAAMDLVADARLTLAVSEAGGFGILGAGYGDAAWLERELAALGEANARNALPFGIGFITWSLARQPHLLDLALAAKPSAVWLSFGDPAIFAGRIKDAGALLVCQVQSVAMAEDAVAKGADIIVAQGGEASGHGISAGSIALVPAIVDAVGEKVPVLMAGGVADGRGLAAALMLGATGIVMGTRFYASEEAAGLPAAKERMIRATADDTLRSIIFDISRQNVWPSPFTGRCLRNEHVNQWAGRELELMRRADVLSDFGNARQRGDFDIAPVIAGEAVGLIRDLPTAGEIVARTVADAERLLAGGGR